MAFWTKIIGGKVMPLTSRPKWVDDNGNPVQDSVLIEQGYLPVDTTYPKHDPVRQRVVQRPTTEWDIKSDKVVAKYDVVNYTVDEMAANIRMQRNSLLAQTDWTQVLDAPMDRTVWANYRQALRDITIQPGFPANISWPTPPKS